MTDPVEGLIADAEELLGEVARARQLDANLARLRVEDPDDAGVLTVGFVEALVDSRRMKQQGEEHRQYVALKLAAGQLYLWHGLFAGGDEAD